MSEIIEDLIGTTTSTFTPFGCIRNCASAILGIVILYVILVIVFVFVQGGF